MAKRRIDAIENLLPTTEAELHDLSPGAHAGLWYACRDELATSLLPPNNVYLELLRLLSMPGDRFYLLLKGTASAF